MYLTKTPELLLQTSFLAYADGKMKKKSFDSVIFFANIILSRSIIIGLGSGLFLFGHFAPIFFL